MEYRSLGRTGVMGQRDLSRLHELWRTDARRREL